MDPQEKTKIEKAIREEIARTIRDVEKLKDLTKPIAPENAIGRISRMDAINNKSVNDAALNKAENKLKSLKIALSNLDDPGFGNCAKCGQPIPLGRIMLLPHSRFCVRCAR